MKTASYARILFGLSSILFGAIALMWHDADTWQALSRIWKLPLGTIIGDCLMIAQIAGGIGLLLPQTTRLGSSVLAVVYALFSLTCVPGIIKAPTVYAQYGSFFEQFALLSGAIAGYAATEENAARSAALGRGARLGLGLCAVSFTLAQIFYFHVTADLVPTWIPPNQVFWAVLTTIAFAFAAVAILINVQARLAMRLMTLMLALFGVFVWVPMLVAHPEAHGNWSEFALNFQITGAAWMVASAR
jgi:uncharacterized membrane protein YphA (DoxX/SURF4 family)